MERPNTTTMTTTTKKRALIRMDDITAINLAGYPMYEIVSAFESTAAACGRGASAQQPPSKTQHKGPFSLRLLRHSLEKEEKESLLFGSLDLDSSVMFACYEGVTYFGSNARNPGSFDAEGQCIEQHCTGVSMSSLLAMFATPKEEHVANPLPFETWNRIFWNASFELLSAPPSSASNVLRFRVYVANPFKGFRKTATFQDTYMMHALA